MNLKLLFYAFFALSQLGRDLKYNFRMPDSIFASLYYITVNVSTNYNNL